MLGHRLTFWRPAYPGEKVIVLLHAVLHMLLQSLPNMVRCLLCIFLFTIVCCLPVNCWFFCSVKWHLRLFCVPTRLTVWLLFIWLKFFTWAWLKHAGCCAEEHVETIVDEGAVDALVPQLHAPVVQEGEGPIACEHEVEKDAAFALGLLAVKVSELYPRSVLELFQHLHCWGFLERNEGLFLLLFQTSTFCCGIAVVVLFLADLEVHHQGSCLVWIDRRTIDCMSRMGVLGHLVEKVLTIFMLKFYSQNISDWLQMLEHFHFLLDC